MRIAFQYRIGSVLENKRSNFNHFATWHRPLRYVIGLSIIFDLIAAFTNTPPGTLSKRAEDYYL
jgi:hypothetical protein